MLTENKKMGLFGRIKTFFSKEEETVVEVDVVIATKEELAEKRKYRRKCAKTIFWTFVKSFISSFIITFMLLVFPVITAFISVGAMLISMTVYTQKKLTMSLYNYYLEYMDNLKEMKMKRSPAPEEKVNEDDESGVAFEDLATA